MTKLVLVSGEEMCKLLKRLSFEKAHQIESHVRHTHSDGRRTVVPIHGNEYPQRGLILEILK